MSGDAATVSVFVRVAPDAAFEVFTQEIDLWWRTGPQYRIAGRRRGQLVFEPRLGGRLFETFALPGESWGRRAKRAGSGVAPATSPKNRQKPEGHTIQVGTVTAWEPPRRLALEWRGVNFKPHEVTLVEVSFDGSGEGTLVTVKHSGWSALPDEHPARHGLVGPDFSRMIGLWWGGLLTSLREHVASR